MSVLRVTQNGVEVVWKDQPPTLRVTQDVLELVWRSGAPALELTQNAVEMVWAAGPSALELTQDAVEIVWAEPSELKYAFTASGGLILSGAAVPRAALTATASGGLRLSGTAATATVDRWAYTATGGLLLSGAAGTDWSAALTATGGLILAGAADASKRGDAPAPAPAPGVWWPIYQRHPARLRYRYRTQGGLAFTGAARARPTARRRLPSRALLAAAHDWMLG